MKKFLLSLTVILSALTLSAQSTYTYSFKIQNLKEEQIKTAGTIGTSLFYSAVQFENENYQVLIFKSSKEVKEEEVKRLYNKNGFQITDFKSEEEKTR